MFKNKIWKMTNIYRIVVHVNLILSSTDKENLKDLFSIFHNSLLKLRCFSLRCYETTEEYHSQVLPLLRRMACLEELTLYIHIWNGSIFISAIHIDNEILIHMPRLYTFTFHIACENDIGDPINLNYLFSRYWIG